MAHRRRPLMTALALNTAAVVVEMGAGVPAKSFSLVMDAVHNLSDEAALAALVLAYSLRTGLSGRWLRAANALNSLGLLVIAGVLGWEALAHVGEPNRISGIVPIVAGLAAAVANWSVARVLREASAEDAAIRLAYVHNRSDTLVALGPVLAGLLILVTGSTVADPIVALAIAVAVVVPAVRVVIGSHEELAWPEDVRCAHPEQSS